VYVCVVRVYMCVCIVHVHFFVYMLVCIYGEWVYLVQVGCLEHEQ
jgi:hypothetical protein